MCHKGPAVRQSDRTGVWTQGLLTTSTKRDYTDIVYIAYSLYSCYGYHTCGTSQGPAMAHWHTVSAYKGYVTEGLHVFILLGFTLKLFTNNENHHPVPSCTYTHTHTHTIENIIIPTHSETERPRVPVQNQQTKELALERCYTNNKDLSCLW